MASSPRTTTVSLSSLKRSKKMVLVIGQRTVALFYHKDHVYCIDEYCYHHGGPLSHGDIEEVHEHSCIICPWHHYKISLNTGEGLYLGMDGQPRSKGVKQRTHQVEVDESSDTVRVTLNNNKDDGVVIESDRYVGLGCSGNGGCSGGATNSNQPQVVSLRELRKAREQKALEKKEIDKTINPYNPKSETSGSRSRFY